MRIIHTDDSTPCDWQLLVYNEEGHLVHSETVKNRTKLAVETWATARVGQLPCSWSSYNVEHARKG